MYVAKSILTIAMAISGIALIMVVIAFASLYYTTEKVYWEVMNGAKVFRYQMDIAWEELVTLNNKLFLPSNQLLKYSKKDNPFESVFLKKREARWKAMQGLPPFCICEIPKIVCPPGPPGPRGAPGKDGKPGMPGTPGHDYQTPSNYEIRQCPWPDTFVCISCPAGPRGPIGAPGEIGFPGPNGIRGKNGMPGADGPPGLPGPVGDPGPDGVQGPLGKAGPPGEDAERLIGKPGRKGPKGPPGCQGIQGDDGENGRKGKRGRQGLQGPPGSPGPAGIDGLRGRPGKRGRPGQDATYCTCPARST